MFCVGFFQVYYLNSKRLLSQNDMTAINNQSNEYVVSMASEASSLSLQPDSEFKFRPVSHDTSTVHVPTNVYDRCKYIKKTCNITWLFDISVDETRRKTWPT